MQVVLDEVKPIFFFTKICGFFPFKFSANGPKITWFSGVVTSLWFSIASVIFYLRFTSQVLLTNSSPIVLIGFKARLFLAYLAVASTYVINLFCREKIWRIFTGLSRFDEKVRKI
jgi:hypothetical protein